MNVNTASAEQCGLPDRIQWAAEMRRKFSPSGMLNAQGEINQDFFKPKRVLLVKEKRWGAEETEQLLLGLEKYGVGMWRDIASELLPAWDDQQIRIRAAKLLGSQSLTRYVGWKGGRGAVQEEYAKNKAIGDATGCWKHGMLVENDEGNIAQYLAQHTDMIIEAEPFVQHGLPQPSEPLVIG